MHSEAGSRNPLKSPHALPDPRSPAATLSQGRERAVSTECRQDRGTRAVSTALLTPRAAVPVVCAWAHLMQLLIQLPAFLTEKMSY